MESSLLLYYKGSLEKSVRYHNISAEKKLIRKLTNSSYRTSDTNILFICCQLHHLFTMTTIAKLAIAIFAVVFLISVVNAQPNFRPNINTGRRPSTDMRRKPNVNVGPRPGNSNGRGPEPDDDFIPRRDFDADIRDKLDSGSGNRPEFSRGPDCDEIDCLRACRQGSRKIQVSILNTIAIHFLINIKFSHFLPSAELLPCRPKSKDKGCLLEAAKCWSCCLQEVLQPIL